MKDLKAAFLEGFKNGLMCAAWILPVALVAVGSIALLVYLVPPK